jgi:D-alanyl-D-alanine carboxypeptidase
MTTTLGIRTIRRRVVAVVAATAVLLVAAMPVASAAEPVATQPAAVDGLQERADRIVAAGSPGAALFLRDGYDTESVAAGLADVDTERGMRAGDRFRVGSVTKSFIATLVLQLVGSGDLALDATVADYRPGLLPDGDVITLRQLLNHTSGLFNYTDDEDFYAAALGGEAFKPRQLIDYSTRHGLLFPPGTDWWYSNTNYVVLGILVRTAGGLSVRAQINERIATPLHLEATSFPVYNKAIRGRHAHGYERDGDLFDVTEFFSPSWAWAAGALVSNASDLTAFYRALFTGELVEPALLEEMMETVPIGDGQGYGLGLTSIDLPCGTAWGHNGDVPGYHAMVLSTQDGARQVAALVNIGAGRSVRAAVSRAVVTTLCGTDGSFDLPPFPTLRWG